MDDYVIPLYDRAKNNIYDEFERMKRQSSVYITAKGSKKKYALEHFKAKFHNFYYEVFIQPKYVHFNKEYREKLDDYFNDLNMIKSREEVLEVLSISAVLMKHLKITNIGYEKNEFGL